MDKTELISKLNEILVEEFETEISALVPDANIRDTLDLDSLGLADMIDIIEDLFGVKIRKHQLANILTFENLYDYIDRNVKR
jgi:acyl carrier protein